MCKIAEWIVLLFLVACSFSDWKRKEIPLFFLLIMSAVVVLLAICCNTESIWSLLGGVLIGILFFVISKCTKEAIGYGDSWIILLLGVDLGGFQVLQLMFVASLAAGICSLFFMWRCHWKRNVTIPFVPFLTVAYLGVMLL